MAGRYDDIGADKPLFGETRPRDRVFNLVLGLVTLILVLVTLISAFVFPQWPPDPVNIYFASCILLVCGANSVLIFWYRQGDLEPKFRTLIYFNVFCIILLAVCCNLYIHLKTK
ncbi:transmembrane protein 243 isoform X3 [Lingula anatina]|nr:transmembrane protein 243 isoform X3 [Lingula anatina]XP_013393319.1 transmembrane protein 243 isoform X3 [Lingula anatina]XP_013393320.1 transmembrane protein 243 isoform X3 [Lingula anatina]|eukprot:XP_013393318.1 transmembrane protein 243 isoform X3 [Lingula anatina]